MAIQRDGFEAAVDRDRIGAGIRVRVGRGSRNVSVAGTVAPVDDHTGAHQRDGDGLVGNVCLPSGDKRALVRC